MAYNPVVHNRHSIRLQGYDYSQSGAYFITICTYKKERFFGEIVNGEMKLNLLGNYAYHQWIQISSRFDNLELDEFVIMPNHVHGIIVIQSDKVEESENNNHFPREKLYSNPSIVQPHRQIQQNGTVPGSIGAIIQNYKSVTTRKINAMSAMKNTKIWQVNYYDHIIRDEADHARIIGYIRENPAKWEQDELF